MHITVQSRYSNALQRPVAAAVLYRSKRGVPHAVASFPAYLNAYRVPSPKEANAYVSKH